MQLKNLQKFKEAQPTLELRKVDFYMQLLDRIHFLLHKHMNGKQKELADALGVSEAAISKLLNGVKNIETETIFKLEEVFGEPIITVVKTKEAQSFKINTYLSKMRRNAANTPSLKEITQVVEEVRTKRYGKKV